MTLTTYLVNELLDHLFGKQTFTAPDVLYAGLCTNCTIAGVITGEPAAGAYARVALDNNDIATLWTAAANKQKINGGGAITFPTATASWGTLTVMFISDAAVAGNIWSFGNLTSAITPLAGVAPVVPTGSLVISEV
jgi:hypothetical protein